MVQRLSLRRIMLAAWRARRAHGLSMSGALKLAWRRFKAAVRVKRTVTAPLRAASRVITPAKPERYVRKPLAPMSDTTPRLTILARVARAIRHVAHAIEQAGNPPLYAAPWF